MAGDWIKMRTDLFTHPKVVRISSALKADTLRTVGGLMSAWCLFDAHSADGRLEGYTLEYLDAHLRWEGFSEAMASVGWLEADEFGLVLPRFDTHNGQSAKRRAQDSDRKREVRKMSASEADKTRTREEKRREEGIPPVSPLAGGEPAQRKSRVPVDFEPNDTAIDKAKQLGVDVGAEVPKFIDYHTAKGSVMVDWQAAFRTWLGNARPIKQAGTAGAGLKYGSDEYFEFHRHQSWWADAGFDSVWDACNHRCNEKNFHQFRDGKKLKEAA